MVNLATGLLATAATVGAVLAASTWFLRHSSRQRNVLATGRSGEESHQHTNGDAKVTEDAGPVTQEAKDWAALYDRMADEFASGDLNPKAIEPLKSWFHGVEDPEETPWPKKYTELEPPLQFGAVRLLVVPLDDSPVVLRIAASVTADVMRLLPDGTKVFANARGNYHCTVFHTSQPTDPRPDPTRPDGGTDPTLEPSRRRLPTDAEWRRELEIVRQLVAATPQPLLRPPQLERVVQASTGVLLLTWTEVGQGAVVSDLRRRLREAFPGASTKQTLPRSTHNKVRTPPKNSLSPTKIFVKATIIHSSLLRIVSSRPLGPAAVDAVSEACRHWTAKLRGTLYTPRTLWFIREMEFSTIEGDREVLTLGDANAPPRHW
ncbi:hypothetical protein VOLCADRAFT_106011 [Volvox carteri f. nagariensis]|uniref:Uncharacterized protein n=1 Tax=Volvox carteri f. nagariensis TaxID=3068 RepID=D8U4J3_VOLCA|nr:uncharacterized protein VOLCADRAFT_106011 [Volvox carteri f. nagariensis]EFJ45201.1 hypothetical protein VOLCADRAFT_106011 [Volvox carteri f. nagariensis]|eukprot:XP_002953577.1 hypothetical protein VOLCADRAFT_106011 [Volvox carteri f. nagariensis]